MYLLRYFASLFANYRLGFHPVNYCTDGGVYFMYLYRPLIVGGAGFKLIYFHLLSYCMMCGHLLMEYLRSFWHLYVKPFSILIKLLLWIRV